MGVKITDLTELTTGGIAPDDVFVVVDVSTDVTKKIQAQYASDVNTYTVDSSEADQGVAGDGRSVKDIVDLVGTDIATMVFSNPTGTASTTFTLTTSETIPSNITLVFHGGAILDGAGTITFDSPEQIEAGDRQQIFGSSITVALTNPGTISPLWFNDAIDDGSTAAQTAISAAITAAAAGSVLDFPSARTYYNCTAAFTVNKAMRLTGNMADIRQATAATGLIVVTASDVEIDHLKLTGKQYANGVAAEEGIDAYGADKDNYISGLYIHHNKIQTWGGDAITGEFVEDFRINNNIIENCFYAGVLGLSWRRGNIDSNNITNISGTPNAYGIALSRSSNDSIVTCPRPSDITVSNNVINGVPVWEGLDTHAGENIVFDSNIVLGCMVGIAVGGSTDSGGAYLWSPMNCLVINNTVDSGVTDGTCSWGIGVTGAVDGGVVQEYSVGCIVANNTVRNHGLKGGATDRTLYFETTRGLKVENNNIINPTSNGIQFYRYNHGFTCTGNTITDVWNETSSTADSISIDNIYNVGFIAGNVFVNGAKAATYLNRWAIRIDDETGNSVIIGKNALIDWTDIDGGYISDAGQKALRGEGAANTVTSGTGEDDLKSQIFPQGTLGEGQKIRVHARGVNQGANDNKTIKFHFGASSITVIPANNNTDAWSVDILIWLDDYTSQRVSALGTRGTAIVYSAHTDWAINTAAAAITMKFTGECANAGDVIVQYTMDVSVE